MEGQEDYGGDPATWDIGVAATVTGDAALVASLKVSLCFFCPLSNGQSLRLSAIKRDD